MSNIDLETLNGRIENLLANLERLNNEASTFGEAKMTLNQTASDLDSLIGEIKGNVNGLKSVVDEVSKLAVDHTLSKFSDCANACENKMSTTSTEMEKSVEKFNKKIDGLANDVAMKVQNQNQEFTGGIATNISELNQAIENVPVKIDKLNQQMTLNINQLVAESVKQETSVILPKVLEYTDAILSKVNIAILASCVAVAVSAYAAFK